MTVQQLKNILSAAEESGRDVFPIPSELARDLIAEIERLGRCNEQISRTFSTIINQQNAEITRLLAIVAHCRRCVPSVVAAAEGAAMQQDVGRKGECDITYTV